MKPLYSENTLKEAKSNDNLPCECYQCSNTFYIKKHNIQRILNPKQHKTGMFCSKKCQTASQIDKRKIKCTNCGLEFERVPSEIGKNNYCSNSCNASYINKHKTTGTRRSKFEMWVESQLPLLYPNLEVHFNRKDTIGSELDIYIPSLKLAFELNGIFHYEPIFGINKFNQIKNNDMSKSKICVEKLIDLHIINIAGLKNFKPTKAQQYLDIITNIISKNILS